MRTVSQTEHQFHCRGVDFQWNPDESGSLPAYSLDSNSPSTRLLRLTVDASVGADGVEIVEALKDHLLQRRELPSKLTVKREGGMQQRPVSTKQEKEGGVEGGGKGATKKGGSVKEANVRREEEVSLEYQMPRGDEVVFGATPADVSFVGHRSMGTLHVSKARGGQKVEKLRPTPQGSGDVDTSREEKMWETGKLWQSQLSFLTWHLQGPPGATGLESKKE
eukprot:GHVS01102780.1.p1 GENE.GHVS01102780.1~~GHVS01102780.1.p1  ORF type:complete len:221 (+),score=49.85 GHVS01102780.1:156-818(+)